jgi:hypothetical protein
MLDAGLIAALLRSRDAFAMAHRLANVPGRVLAC